MPSSNIFKQFSLPLSFGGAAVSGQGGGYGFGDIKEEDAVSLLNYSFDRGIRIFDSAPVYGFGMSEYHIGKAFKQNREDVFITSKSGVTWHDSMRINMTNDPKITQKMLEQSLKDLASEYIDLYFIHWPDKHVDIRKPMEVLAKAQAEGKISHIGLCNTTSDDLSKAQEIGNVEVIQAEYNFFSRYDQEVLKAVDKSNMGFMSYGTFDKGVLTKRVTAKRESHHEYDHSDCRRWAPWWKQVDRTQRFLSVEKLERFLQVRGYSLVEFALGFNLSHPQVDSLLCGMRTHAQVDSVLEALSHLPTDEILQECEQFYVS